MQNDIVHIKSHRGHKKAIIAICKMLLTAIWIILSTGEAYNASGYLIQTPRPTDETNALTQKQALQLLRLCGYFIKEMSSWSDPSCLVIHPIACLLYSSF